MRKSGQSGFTLIEVLLVCAIFGIIAAILIPSILVTEKRRDATRFHELFGINPAEHTATQRHRERPTTEWLDDEQKLLIQPLVASRLHDMCDSRPSPPSVLEMEPTTDPDDVNERLRLLQDQWRSAEETHRTCSAAHALAEKFGFAP